MLRIRAYIIFIFLQVAFLTQLAAQSKTLEIQLTSQPGNYIVLGKIYGDNFEPADTIPLQRAKSSSNNDIKIAKYSFPEKATPGIYQLDLGKTTYARVMDEPSQQINFIFNNEDLIFETDFEKPEDNLLVVLSEENRVWFEFLKREKNIQQKLEELKLEVDYYREKGNGASNSGNALTNSVTQYNNLQVQREEFITEMLVRNQELFASKLIDMYREPFIDGNLPIDKRREIFQKTYFDFADFSNEALIQSNVYTDRIFNYLTSYNRKGFSKNELEKEYIKAVDIVLKKTNKNAKVYAFILNYLVHGFEVLKMENVLAHIANKYSGTTCQTDEKTTLERKLEARKMKPGTTVPDFTLPDLEGYMVRFSDLQDDTTLLVFWASWCPHCTEIIPQIKYSAQTNNLQVVTVSLDTSKSAWQNAIESLGIESWTNLSNLKKWEGEVATNYNIYATPTMFIIDENLKIISVPTSVTQLTKSNITR